MDNKRGVGVLIGGIAVFVIGLLFKQIFKELGKYLGFYLLIPLAAVLVCGWIASKTVKTSAQPMVPAFAIQAGHALWMGLGALILDQWSLVIGDIFIIILGLMWLMTQPGLGPVILLTVYQVAAFIVNLNVFSAPEADGEVHRALLVTMILRILAVIMLFVGLNNFNRKTPKL